jgi:hypothetical protein
MKVLAKCPYDCHKVPGTVYGMGIHPENSPICLAAMVDNAVSYYGGIISISIFPGLDNYDIPENMPNKRDLITIKSFAGATMKSYVVSKVDNIDLVEKDFRILDHSGKLSNEGRLEIRLDGKWGTICANGNDMKWVSEVVNGKIQFMRVEEIFAEALMEMIIVGLKVQEFTSKSSTVTIKIKHIELVISYSLIIKCVLILMMLL